MDVELGEELGSECFSEKHTETSLVGVGRLDVTREVGWGVEKGLVICTVNEGAPPGMMSGVIIRITKDATPQAVGRRC